jgi:nitroreductase
MNNVIEAILSRRSIRKYKTDAIADGELQQIIEAAKYAPSGMNTQSWHFSVIQNREKIEALEAVVYEAIKGSEDPYLKKMSELGVFHYFYGAPVLVIISNAANSISLSPVSDAALAAGNMMLAAHALGLGSCWIHILTRLRDEPEVKAALRALGVPKGYVVCSALTLGYPDGPLPKAAERREGTVNIVE